MTSKTDWNTALKSCALELVAGYANGARADEQMEKAVKAWTETMLTLHPELQELVSLSIGEKASFEVVEGDMSLADFCVRTRELAAIGQKVA